MITRNQVFDRVATALEDEFDGIFVTSKREPVPPQFPCVWCLEVASVPERQYEYIDLSSEHRRSTFEVQTFSNLEAGADSQARNIMEMCINLFRGMGYRCTYNQQMDNVDSSISRQVARFTRLIGGSDELPE